MSSHVSRLTRHCQDTHPRHSPCSDRSFLDFSWACCATLPSHIPRIPSCHQYNGMCYLHSFAGKTHQVRSRPAGGCAILTCIPSGVAFTLPETKTYWTRSHRQPATSSASCDGHRRRLFIRPDGTYFTETCSRQTHDCSPSTRASCGVPLPFPVAGADTNLSDPIIARPSKMVGGAGQAIWKARTEGELSDRDVSREGAADGY
jgi:hypothetical protein